MNANSRRRRRCWRSSTAGRHARSQIDIFEDGHGGWLLEAIDEYNNSTVWDDPFDTDQAALDEALDVVENEGIEALIGPESGRAE
jgi:hypothetical protein